MRIVLLSNPASGRFLRNRSRLTSALAGLPEVAHHELAGPLDTKALARADILAINGGDGTTQRVLTELMEGPMSAALPPIAILAGGTTNMTANDIGLRGDPVRALRRLVAAARFGGLESRTRARPVLRVAGGVDIGPQRGLFFGAAGIVDAIRHCKQAVHSRGLKGEWASLATLVSLLARAATRGLDAVGVGGQNVTARLADGRQFDGPQLLVLASTLDRLILRSNPFWDSRDSLLRLTAIARHPPGLFRRTLRVLYGPSERHLPADAYRSFATTGAELRFTGAFTLDGELFAAEAARPLLLSADETICCVRL